MQVIDLNTPKPHEIVCIRSRGGKKPVWNAWHKSYIQNDVGGYARSAKRLTFCGAGNSADNAIKDFQKQFRAWVKNLKEQV